MTIGFLILIGCIFAAAALVQGVCGFGFSLLSIGLLSMFIDPKIAIPLDLLAASANCVYLAWLLRDSINFKETSMLVALSIFFVPAGTLFLRSCPKEPLMMILGAIIILVSLLSVFKLRQWPLFTSGVFKWFSGITSGLLGGAFNIPGPCLVLYAYNCGWPVRTSIANLQFIFSVMTVATIISFWWAGLLSKHVIIMGISYMPEIVLFTLLGTWFSRRIETRHLQIVINIAMVMMGLCLVIKR
jgi:uncharacterized protein